MVVLFIFACLCFNAVRLRRAGAEVMLGSRQKRCLDVEASRISFIQLA